MLVIHQGKMKDDEKINFFREDNMEHELAAAGGIIMSLTFNIYKCYI